MSASAPDSSSAVDSPASAPDPDVRPDYHRLLTEQMQDLVCLHERDGTFMWASPSSQDILGMAPSDLVGQDPYDLMHPDDRDRVRSNGHEPGLENPNGAAVTFRMQHADGHFVWLETLAQPLEDDDGTVVGLQTTSRDVTDRRRAELSRKRSEERLRVGLALSNVSVFNQDADLTYTWVTNRLAGINPDALIGTTDADWFDPDSAEELTRLKSRVLDEQNSLRTDVEIRRDDERVALDLYLEPLVDDAGRSVGLTGAARDVTDERRTVETLKANTERAVRILSSITDGFLALDDDGEVLYANDAAATLLQSDRATLTGRPLTDAAPGIATTRLYELLQRAADEQVPVQLTEHLDPFDVWVRAKAYPFDGGLSVYFTDVTAEQEAKQAFFSGQDRAAALLESIGTAFFALDDDWTFTYVNQTAERLLQRSSEALVGQSVWDAFPEAVGSRFEFEYRRVMEENVAVDFTEYFAPLDLWVKVHAFPFQGGLSVHFTDVSEIKEKETALRESERRHQIALDAAGLAEFDVNLQTGRVQGSALADVLGFVPNDEPFITALARRVSASTWERLRHAVRRAAQNPEPLDLTIDVDHPRHGPRTLSVHAETTLGPDGHAHVIGVMRDVTDA